MAPSSAPYPFIYVITVWYVQHIRGDSGYVGTEARRFDEGREPVRFLPFLGVSAPMEAAEAVKQLYFDKR